MQMKSKIESLADLQREQAWVEMQIKSKEAELKLHIDEVNSKIQPVLSILGKFGFGNKNKEEESGIISTVLKAGIPAVIGGFLLKKGGKLLFQSLIAALIPVIITKISTKKTTET